LVIEERLAYARKLEQEEKILARERMESGGKENFPEGQKGQYRDIVAEKSGFGSGKQYEKAKFVMDNADPEVIKQF
jgi:ParB family chromosome partitioning protein